MKRAVLILLAMALASAAFSQEQERKDLEISGEMKSGLLWEKYENGLDALNNQNVYVNIGSKDDAGKGPGRFRINVDYFNSGINVGFKFRLNWEKWNEPSSESPPWPYAFGYGKFFNKQLTMSLGKLGASPWGTGGPEKWTELESGSSGMRFEYEPVFVPGLNAGLVLNGFNGSKEEWIEPYNLFHLLSETVVGVSYTHDFFHARMAFRFDSEADSAGRLGGWANGKEGGELVYRLEERIIKNYLPGFSIWAMGYFKGVGVDKANIDAGVEYFSTWNWLFFQYAPDLFTAQLRLGYDASPYGSEGLYSKLYIKPSFYVNLFDNLLKVGASFEYTKDFGEVTKLDHPDAAAFRKIEAKPLVQLNLSPNAYAAFEYSFSREWVKNSTTYIDKGIKPLLQNQWMNIRFGISY